MLSLYIYIYIYMLSIYGKSIIDINDKIRIIEEMFFFIYSCSPDSQLISSSTCFYWKGKYIFVRVSFQSLLHFMIKKKTAFILRILLYVFLSVF